MKSMRILLEDSVDLETKQKQIRRDLEKLSNYKDVLEDGQFEYIIQLTKLYNDQEAYNKYLDYLENLKISFDEDTVRLINILQDQNKIDIYDSNSIVNDESFFNDRNNSDFRDKLKTYLYFTDEANAKKWGFESSEEALNNFKEDNNWKSMIDIRYWLDSIQSKHQDATQIKAKSADSDNNILASEKPVLGKDVLSFILKTNGIDNPTRDDILNYIKDINLGSENMNSIVKQLIDTNDDTMLHSIDKLLNTKIQSGALYSLEDNLKKALSDFMVNYVTTSMRSGSAG